MALSTATITLNLADMLGAHFDTRRTKIWVSTNVPDDTVIDTVGNAIRIGTGAVTLATDGTGSVTVWIPGTGSNPSTWQTSIHVSYPDSGTRTRRTRTFGPYTITASANLADLVEEVVVESTVYTVDSSIAALIGSDSLGPLTRAAISALVGGGGGGVGAAGVVGVTDLGDVADGGSFRIFNGTADPTTSADEGDLWVGP